MLARDALCRLAADMPKPRAQDVPRLACLLHQTLFARNALNVSAARAVSHASASAMGARRAYATALRPKAKAAPAKKVVKATAKKTPTRATSKTTKAAPKKKPAAAKKPVKKAAAKKKPVVKKKKKPAAKKVAKKRAKKVLTPEAREKAAVLLLRKKALRAPVSHVAVSAFNAFITDTLAGAKVKGVPGKSMQQDVADASRKYKTLTPAEHEHYNRLASESTAARRAEYQAWIRTHTVDEIRIANNARTQLRRKFAGTLKTAKFPAHTAKLVDDRQPKRPANGFVRFFKERWASGDFKNIKTTEASKLAAKEWKALSASEKKKFSDKA